MNIYNSLGEIKQDLATNSISCVKLVENYLSAIKENAHLNAFLEVFSEEALSGAAAIDQKIQAGKAGKLAGMVIAIKDNICYKNHKVSAASKILENFTSLYSASAVERLIEEDAIIIGRLNCDEFAMGGSNENSAYGNVLNPLNTKRVPGGSSGGSAAAVAANLCLVALGSDTGGSIRQPAAFCGVMGLKPSYGRVSRYGLIAYASSFDQIGPLGRSIEDLALVMEVIAGNDAYDSTVSSRPVPAYRASLKFERKAKVAYIKECLDSPGLDPEIKTRMQEVINSLKASGHSVEEVGFPYLEHMVPAYYVLTTAEASSNLSRYGGVTYGHRSPNATDIDSTFRKSRTEGFGDEVKRRIMLGTFVLSAGYYDAYYAKAQKVRRLVFDKTNAILKDYDFILMPSTPSTAFEIGQIKDPITMYLEDIFTVHANLTGHPAISIPVGKHSNGLPFGLQLMAGAFKEADLLAFATSLTQVS